MKFKIIIEVDGDQIIGVTTEKAEESTTEVIEQEKPNEFDEYTRVFDDGCRGWTKNPEYNRMFLMEQQRYFNDLLRAKGHLFLNEVFDRLGMPRTSAGQVVGWIYDEANPIGDNYVDFGLLCEQNYDFINGLDRVAILNFNVDGNILNRL